MTYKNKHYYQGAIDGYERELKRIEEAGICFKYHRLEQFKAMLADYEQMQEALEQIAALDYANSHTAVQLAKDALTKFPLQEK